MTTKKLNYYGHSFHGDNHDSYEFAEFLSDPYPRSKLRKVKLVQSKDYNHNPRLPYYLVEYKGERYQAVSDPLRDNVLIVNDLRKRNFLKERIKLYEIGRDMMDVRYGRGNW